MKLLIAMLLIASSALHAHTLLDDTGKAVPQPLMELAAAELAKTLSDPRSLQIRNMRRTAYTGFYCGEFNSRGPGGGFTPFRAFYVYAGGVQPEPEPSNPLFGYLAKQVAERCGP